MVAAQDMTNKTMLWTYNSCSPNNWKWSIKGNQVISQSSHHIALWVFFNVTQISNMSVMRNNVYNLLNGSSIAQMI